MATSSSQNRGVCRFDNEEHYFAQAFERFWQTMAERQQLECTALSTADILASKSARCTSGYVAVPMRDQKECSVEPPNAGVLHRKDDMNARQWWECMQQLFPDVRERRVAYLVFHCNLSSQDIFCFAPQEFRDVQEIRHLRLHILERIPLHSDHTIIVTGSSLLFLWQERIRRHIVSCDWLPIQYIHD